MATDQQVSVEVPSEFICPITMDVMVHPLVTKYGLSFERQAIIAWLEKGSGVCPLTRRPLKMSDLIHNNALGAKIRSWRHANANVGKCGGGCNSQDETTSVDDYNDDDDDSFDISQHIYGTGDFPFTAVAGPERPLPLPSTISTTSTPASPRSVRSVLFSPLLRMSPQRRQRQRGSLTLVLQRMQAPQLEGPSL